MACSDSERAIYLQKQAKYAQISSFIRPNRNLGRFSPPPVHLPPRKKMRAA